MDFREGPYEGCRQIKVAKDDASDILFFVVLNIVVLLSKSWLLVWRVTFLINKVQSYNVT